MEHQIININSKYNVSDDTYKYILDVSGFLYNTWRSVPVYLVNIELMDFISPPEKNRGLDEDCVREIVGSYCNHRYNDNNFQIDMEQRNYDEVNQVWRYLSECNLIKLVSRGVYINHLDSDIFQKVQDEMLVRIPFNNAVGNADERFSNHTELTNVLSIDELSRSVTLSGSSNLTLKYKEIIKQHRNSIQQDDVIYICMDRIISDAESIHNQYGFKTKDINEIIKIITVYVILHELTHAYIKCDAKKYNESWGKLLEESLVAAYANAALKDNPYYSVLKADLASKPLEYRASTFFDDYDLINLKYLIDFWRKDNSKSFLFLCPLSDISAFYKGNTGHWPTKDYDFERLLRDICYPAEVFWKLISKEILEKTSRRFT